MKNTKYNTNITTNPDNAANTKNINLIINGSQFGSKCFDIPAKTPNNLASLPFTLRILLNDSAIVYFFIFYTINCGTYTAINPNALSISMFLSLHKIV